MRRTCAGIAALAVLAALALAGCSALGLPDPAGSPTRTPTPTPTTEPFALDCPSVVAAADLDALFGAKPAPLASPPGLLDGSAARGPLALRAVGGADCRWAHGADTLTVRVLPHAGATWARLAEIYPDSATPGADYDGGVSLGGDCTLTPTVWCRTNVLAGDAWLAVDLSAKAVPGLTESGFHDAVQRMLPTVTAAVASRPVPPAGQALDCNADDLRTELQTAFDRPAVTSMGVEESFRIDAAVLLTGGTTICQFQPNDDGSGGYLGSLSVLRDGAAAYETLRSAVLRDHPDAQGATITVGGDTVPALVWNGTTEGMPFGAAEALVGTAWIEFRSLDTDTDRSLQLVQWAAGTL